MKDIDFDELDKAVNSLMTKRPQKDSNEQSAVPSAPSEDTPDIPDTAAPVSPGTIKPKSEVATNPDAQPAVTPEPKDTSIVLSSSASRAAAPASRRSGRFMDVVPKKATTPSVAPTRPVSREGVTIGPRPGVTAPVDVSSTPTSPSLQSQTPTVTEKTAPASDWPDPIEMATPKKEPATNDAEISQPQNEAKSPEQEALKDQPLSSPFLPDTKVEKRPLGSPMPTPSLPEDESKIAVPDDSAAQLPARPSDVTPETPEEFRGDLMKVEADTHMGLPKTDESHPEAVEPEKAKTPGKDLETREEAPAKPKVTERADSLTGTDASSGRISIPPQYKEQPSTGEKESGAIYDTSTYHQPLSHPAKKKSGWLWVLWIVLILIVGAAAGAALYFLGVM